MTDEDHDSRSNRESGRRRFLRTVGTLGLAGVGLPALSGRSGATGDDSGPEAFRVTGREVIRTEITPETVTVHKRKISEDLRRRYGLTPPVLTKTETLERPAPGEDDLPERDTTTIEREWDTYYAKEAPGLQGCSRRQVRAAWGRGDGLLSCWSSMTLDRWPETRNQYSPPATTKSSAPGEHSRVTDDRSGKPPEDVRRLHRRRGE